jgi:6-phosphofructokinase 1
MCWGAFPVPGSFPIFTFPLASFVFIFLFIMDFTIKTLGPRRVPSPVKLSKVSGDFITNYVNDGARAIIDPLIQSPLQPMNVMESSFEVAGPRENIFFDPSKTRCAIVTCGGLCPGINDVIHSIVMELWYLYGVRHILGICYGYHGFLPEYGYESRELTPDFIKNIHHTGGSVLGSSRGHVPPEDVVDCLER